MRHGSGDESAREADLGRISPRWLPGRVGAERCAGSGGTDAARGGHTGARYRTSFLARPPLWAHEESALTCDEARQVRPDNRQSWNGSGPEVERSRSGSPAANWASPSRDMPRAIWDHGSAPHRRDHPTRRNHPSLAMSAHTGHYALVPSSPGTEVARWRFGCARRVVAGVLLLALGVGGAGCDAGASPAESSASGPPRVAVRWRAVTVSADRRTIHVFGSYPVSLGCVKSPAGVDLRIEGDAAVLAVWMTGDGLSAPSATCTAECSIVPQDLTLSSPLPANVSTFVPIDGAVDGCYSADTPLSTELPSG